MPDKKIDEPSLNQNNDENGQSEESAIDLDLAITLYFALLQSLSPEDKLKLITTVRLIGHMVIVTEELGTPRPPSRI
jgi:hypothetical protein